MGGLGNKALIKYLNDIPVVKCEVCEKTIDGLIYDLKNYAYKIQYGYNKTYFCCYPHMKEYKQKNNIK